MLRLSLLSLAVFLLAAQTVEPPVFPAGQFCVHVTQGERNPAHPCACQRECKPDEDADGHQTVRVQEDAQCKQYCHKEHCHCPVKGCD